MSQIDSDIYLANLAYQDALAASIAALTLKSGTPVSTPPVTVVPKLLFTGINATIIGDGVTVDFAIVHNLNSLILAIFPIVGRGSYNITMPDANTLHIIFDSAPSDGDNILVKVVA